MKTFRLIGIAIMAILISVNFASCSSDDDEEETNSEYKALLGSWQMSEQDGDILVTSSFIFNSNGTIASLMQKMAIVMKFIRVSLPMMLILIK